MREFPPRPKDAMLAAPICSYLAGRGSWIKSLTIHVVYRIVRDDLMDT